MGDFHINVICLILVAMFPDTFAVSCENNIRLADLQYIIKNQTNLIEDQKNTIENMTKIIENQTYLNDYLKKKIEIWRTGNKAHVFMKTLQS